MLKAVKFFYKSINNKEFISPYMSLYYKMNTYYSVNSPLIICHNGFHFPCNLKGVTYWAKEYFSDFLIVCVIEIQGELIFGRSSYKAAVEKMRIIDTIEIPRIANNKRESIRALLRELRLNHPELLYYHHDFLNKFTNYDFHSKKAILNFE